MGAFSDRVDIVAAHKCVFGEWHEEYERFETDSNRYIGVPSDYLSALVGVQTIDPYWLKQYISDLLVSADYSFKYVRLPYLVGSYFTSNIVNYQSNRYDFINRHFQHKYAHYPNIQQLTQVSYKMLQWWGTFEPEYWELPSGTKTDPQSGFNGIDPDSPPRRDMFVPVPVAGGSAVRRTYEAGEVAVDFIFNLAKETEFRDGVPYILSTSELRDNQFTVATLMHLLWKANADVLTDNEVNLIAQLPIQDAIKAILMDYRYTSRHNIILAGSEKLGTDFPHWKKTIGLVGRLWIKIFHGFTMKI